MAIGNYLKEIGRGKDGARALQREQAADLMVQILDGVASDLEVGAFCLAMRVKGETPQELAGFLDAAYSRIALLPPQACPLPTIVIPSYNGARKLPGLTALLAMLLAREGFPVLVHGTPTEDKRVFCSNIFEALGVPVHSKPAALVPGQVAFCPTGLLCAGLQKLLDVRRVVQLRNPAHSLVKMMTPCQGPSILVSSYTHPEYAVSMAQTLQIMGSNALLLRGTEGEAVADPRRSPKTEVFKAGQLWETLEAQPGSLVSLPHLPTSIDAQTTAHYTRLVLDDTLPVPEPLALQITRIKRLAAAL